MRAIIIDDESLAREELARLIADIPDLSLVGEATNGLEGLLLITQERPDLVFLDVEMPGMTGFEMLEKLPPPHPSIIFTTAYEEFALKAFDVDAVDYLLKPIDPVKLARAVAKLEPAMGAGRPLVGVSNGLLKADDRVFVRDGARCWFVKVGGIRLLESEGNYTRVYIGNDKPLIYGALKSFHARLDPSCFFRANRNQIINLANVEKVSVGVSEELIAHMTDGTQVAMSRRMAQQFREQLGF